MKFSKVSLLLLVSLLTLGAARCGSPDATNAPDIASASVSTGIKYTNEPELALETISASASAIYLSANVVNPEKGSEVRVNWYKLPNRPVASETFAGKRTTSGNNLDFDYKKPSSWLASRVERPGLSWELGEYRIEVFLGSRLAKTVFFTVVSDSEAQKVSAQKAVQSVSFSDTLDDNDRLISPKTTFAREAANIYIQVSFGQVQAGTDIEVGIRFVKENRQINTFTAVTGESDHLLFSLPRDRFGRLWSDKLWPVGSFEVTVKVGGVTAKTTSFVVR